MILDTTPQAEREALDDILELLSKDCIRPSENYAADLAGAKRELSNLILNNIEEDASRAPHQSPPDIISVGIGGGQVKKSGFLAVRVGVATEEALEQVPSRVQGIPVVAQLQNAFRPYGRHRPVRPGCSVSLTHSTAQCGTLGGFVTVKGDSYLLSADHVLDNFGNVSNGEVIQPGIGDGGHPYIDIIARVASGSLPRTSYLDAQIAPMDRNIKLDPRLHFTITRKSFRPPVVLPVRGQPVKKYGKRTRETAGRISQVAVDVVMHYPRLGRQILTNQFLVSGNNMIFSDKGDSGSVVYSKQRQPVGLLIGGNGHESVCTRMDEILSHFGASFTYG